MNHSETGVMFTNFAIVNGAPHCRLQYNEIHGFFYLQIYKSTYLQSSKLSIVINSVQL